MTETYNISDLAPWSEGEGKPGKGPPGQGKGKPGGGKAGTGEQQPQRKPGEGFTMKDIDDNARRIMKEVENKKDVGKDRQKERGAESHGDQDLESGNPGGAGKNGEYEIDYTKVRPTYSWQAIIDRFVSSAHPLQQETYSKPARRAATGVDLLQKTGAAAVKPGEREAEHEDVALAFVVDSSGSMTGSMSRVYSNIASLLNKNEFAKSDFLIIRFSGEYDMHKGNFVENKAATISKVTDQPSVYNTTVQKVFTTHFGAGTDFSGECVTQIASAMKLGYNVLIFSDSDIVHAQNFGGLMLLIKLDPHKVFVIFNNRDTYLAARQTPGMVNTPNISHLS